MSEAVRSFSNFSSRFSAQLLSALEAEQFAGPVLGFDDAVGDEGKPVAWVAKGERMPSPLSMGWR